MRPNNPLVSVVLPVYNASKYLPEALQSIIDQTYTHFELIVVDDASSDNSWDIINQFAARDNRVKPFRNDINSKLSHTLNKGIEAARGVYVVRMDADDISLPDRLMKQVQYMESHPEVGISGGSMYMMRDDGTVFAQRRYNLEDDQIRAHIFRYSPYSHPTVIIRALVLQKVGGYEAKYNPAEDYELYFRIGAVSQFGNLPDILIKYRVLQKSMTTGSTRHMELQTIRIRQKYSHNARYHFGFVDKCYNFLHLMSLYIFPTKLKMHIFNILRNG